MGYTEEMGVSFYLRYLRRFVFVTKEGCVDVQGTEHNTKSCNVVTVLLEHRYPHHLAGACTPRTSRLHCSFGFALVLRN